MTEPGRADGPPRGTSEFSGPAGREYLVTSSVKYLTRIAETGTSTITSRQLIVDLLESHKNYFDHDLWPRFPQDGRPAGALRSVGAHLDLVRERWDAEAPVISGRHVIIGLALDVPEVGYDLLTSGVLASMLSRWLPGRGIPGETEKLVWDELSDDGRGLAEEQPLLALAFGAPPETSTDLDRSTPVSALAWSPEGDKIAAVCGDEVITVSVDSGEVTRIADGRDLIGVGWSPSGVRTLALSDGRASVVRLSDGGQVSERWGAPGAEVRSAVLSGDGLVVWTGTSEGAFQWTLDGSRSVRVDSPTLKESVHPWALDYIGRLALLHVGFERNALVVAPDPGGSRVGSRTWPSDAAPLLGWAAPGSTMYAIPDIGSLAVVVATSDGLEVRGTSGDMPGSDSDPGLLICRLANPGGWNALAVDATGTKLAFAEGSRIHTYSLAFLRRGRRQLFAGVQNDRPDTTDLLDAELDAQSIAALVSAHDVQTPLSIGLFGDWGSGKSFILHRVQQILGGERREGYLPNVRAVEFNAWQYAETNIWASLVESVLRGVGPLKDPKPPPEVAASKDRVVRADQQTASWKAQIDKAADELETTRHLMGSRRRRLVWVQATVVVLALAFLQALLVFGTDWLTSATATALATLGIVSGVVAVILAAIKDAGDVLGNVRSAARATQGLWGRADRVALAMQEANLQQLQRKLAEAENEATSRRDELERTREMAVEQPLDALLEQLALVTEYRDQLTMVTRTRERFELINNALLGAFGDRALSASGTVVDPSKYAPKNPIDRVVVIIDDLDRCPPEKVVEVLETVHLLFSLEMFVVLIAVDTRWLEQALRIRYRRLLGRSGTAETTDYLEKIIQVPLHLPALDEGRVRSMIEGLAGVSEELDALPPESTERPAETLGHADDSTSESKRLLATKRRASVGPVPAEVLRLSRDEVAALTEVAGLVGTTPRTVKRFVNTYRLVRARAEQRAPAATGSNSADEARLIAFLLAVLVGQPSAAPALFDELDIAGPTPLSEVVEALHPSEPSEVSGSAVDPEQPKLRRREAAQTRREAAQTEKRESGLMTIGRWLARRPGFAATPAQEFAPWLPEVTRYSFATHRPAKLIKPREK